MANFDFRKLEKELVAEQPGLAVSVTGLLLALFMGLAVRAALSPERILQLVEKAAAKIDTRFNAKVGGAYVSFSDGLLPQFAVVVKDFSLESDEKCWLRPTLEVDELKLPLDLWSFMRGQIHIHEVLAHEVGISLRSDLSDCQKGQAATTSNSGLSKASSRIPAAATTAASSWESFSRSRDSIDTIHIERMRVHYLPVAFSSFEIRSLDVNVQSKSPKKITADGILNLNGETLSGDYSSTGSLKIDFTEGASPDWKVSLDGNWREGHYLIATDYSSESQFIRLSSDMNQIPLNQLFPLLRKYHLLSSNFNGRQVWLSLKGDMEGDVHKLASLPAKFDLIRIEGNIGEIEAKNMEVKKFEPFTFKPIDVDIKSLQLDSLMTFLNRPLVNPIFGRLGVFHGKAHFEDSQNVQVKGENTGLEFVFSSRGTRQTQSISLLAGELKFSNSKWNIKVDKVKPVEGVFLGDINVEADHNWSQVAVHTKVDELSLGPAVQKLITNGGEIGSIDGDLQFHFDHGNLSTIQGHMTASDVAIEKLHFKRSRVVMTTSKDQNTHVDIRVQGMATDAGSPVHKFLQKVMELPQDVSDEISYGSAQVVTHQLDDFHWDDLVLQMSSHKTLRSKGGWDKEGHISGQVEVSNGPGRVSKFELGGLRDRPQINPAKK
jgi:hypothetical protein